MSIVSGLQWAQYDIFFAQYDINTPNINTAPANFDYNSLPERGHQALFLHESTESVTKSSKPDSFFT